MDEIAAQKKELEQATEAVAKAKLEARAILDSVNVHETKKEELQKEIESLTREMVIATESLADLHKDEKKKTLEIATLEDFIKEKQDGITALNKMHSDMSASIEELKRAHATETDVHHVAHTKRILTANTEIEALKTQIKAHQSGVEKLLKQDSDLTAKLEETHKEKTSLVSVIETHKSTIKSLEEKKNGIQNTLVTLEVDQNNKEKLVSELSGKIGQLEIEIRTLEELEALRKSELAELEEKIKKAKEEVEELDNRSFAITRREAALNTKEHYLKNLFSKAGVAFPEN